MFFFYIFVTFEVFVQKERQKCIPWKIIAAADGLLADTFKLAKEFVYAKAP